VLAAVIGLDIVRVGVAPIAFELHLVNLPGVCTLKVPQLVELNIAYLELGILSRVIVCGSVRSREHNKVRLVVTQCAIWILPLEEHILILE
jgi:hypothetical protein